MCEFTHSLVDCTFYHCNFYRKMVGYTSCSPVLHLAMGSKVVMWKSEIR